MNTQKSSSMQILPTDLLKNAHPPAKARGPRRDPRKKAVYEIARVEVEEKEL